MNSSSNDRKKLLEKALLNEDKEKNVRDRLVSKFKSAQEQELEDQRLKLRKAIEGKNNLIKYTNYYFNYCMVHCNLFSLHTQLMFS